jgi:plastocyanin
MQRLDPVGIAIKLQKGNIVFVPDPQGLIQTNGIVFFTNETAFPLNITLAGKPFIAVAANDESDGIPVPSSGPQALGCDRPFDPYTLMVSDQLSLIQPGVIVTFMPLLLAPGNWVVWQNNDSEVHQPAPDQGTTWTTNPPGVQPYDWSVIVQFPTHGNFPYHCALHRRAELGRIVVPDQQVGIQPGSGFGNAITISAGQFVNWTNADAVIHQPVPTSGPPWTSQPGPINPNDFSDAVQFNAAGTYSYACKFHPSETGQIIVS